MKYSGNKSFEIKYFKKWVFKVEKGVSSTKINNFFCKMWLTNKNYEFNYVKVISRKYNYYNYII